MLQRILYLFLSFSKVGVLGYGGGPSMIPLVQADVVEGYKWMSMTEFTDALAMGYALPGPIATKMSVVVGYKVAGPLGALSALLGMILPSAILVLALYIFFFSFKDNPAIESLLRGIRPVVLALLAVVVIDMAPNAAINLPTIILAVVTLAVFILTNLHPAFAIIAGGLIGVLFF